LTSAPRVPCASVREMTGQEVLVVGAVLCCSDASSRSSEAIWAFRASTAGDDVVEVKLPRFPVEPVSPALPDVTEADVPTFPVAALLCELFEATEVEVPELPTLFALPEPPD